MTLHIFKLSNVCVKIIMMHDVFHCLFAYFLSFFLGKWHVIAAHLDDTLAKVI
jgi:hypothetical protein